MNALMKQSREAQIVLAGTVLYVILSFLSWNGGGSGSINGVNYSYPGANEWHGFGVIAGLVAFVLLAWEIGRLIEFKVELGPITPGVGSVGLALLLALLTLIRVLEYGARDWAAWVSLILSIGIGMSAFRRAQAEGVQMPQMPKNIGGMSGGSGGSSSSGSSTDTPSSTDPPADA